MAVPLALLVAAAGVQVTESGRAAAEARVQGELATASIGPAGAINALMTERNYTSLWLFGVEEGIELHVDSLAEARARTDASLEAFVDEVRRRGGRAERIYGPAIEALEGLAANRERVDSYEGERNPLVDNPSGDRVWATYNQMVTALADANSRLAHEIEDTELRQGVRLIDLASRHIDRISQLVRESTIEAVRADGPITDRDLFARVIRMMTEADRSHFALLDQVTGPYAHLREPLRLESEATGIFGVQQRFRETGEVHVAGLLQGVSLDQDESYYGFIRDVTGIVQARADDLAADARAGQRRTIVLVGLLLLAAAAAAVAVARSITEPLRSLTLQARDMADRRLPEAVREVHETPLGQDVVVPDLEPVTVRSRDEVADLAEQLNAVQMAALDLAVEQAVLRRNFADVFVNLCRRIQGLLGRQLDVITDVVGSGAPEERRPGRTSAPDLAEVSRYALRLRRHAESLLVLAGVEPRPAPDTPREPAPLADIVRAALDEVVGAERVRVVGIEPVLVAGSAVVDLAHLLAELVESALRELFPEETVDVAGAAVAGPGSGYVLSIVDPCATLTGVEIERANRRLAGEEPGTTAPSRHLGQHVAARLAARHGMTVALSAATGAGVTATVHLPADLVLPVLPAPTVVPAGPPAPEPIEPAAPDAAAPGAAGDHAEVRAGDRVEVRAGDHVDDADDEPDLDVYRALSAFPGGVERPALAVPGARRSAPPDEPSAD
ncbi:MAG TPA: HAMP domain-containing protein [Acidimicrobiales bacterium]